MMSNHNLIITQLLSIQQEKYNVVYIGNKLLIYKLETPF